MAGDATHTPRSGARLLQLRSPLGQQQHVLVQRRPGLALEADADDGHHRQLGARHVRRLDKTQGWRQEGGNQGGVSLASGAACHGRRARRTRRCVFSSPSRASTASVRRPWCKARPQTTHAGRGGGVSRGSTRETPTPRRSRSGTALATHAPGRRPAAAPGCQTPTSPGQCPDARPTCSPEPRPPWARRPPCWQAGPEANGTREGAIQFAPLRR